MKIRNGFVSNSSSSSFIAYGKEVNLTNEEILKAIKKIDKGKYKELIEEYKEEDWDIDDLDSYELYEILGDLLEKSIEYCTNDDGGCYFGIPYENIGDDETGRQFKDRIENALKDLDPEQKCGHIEYITYC